MALRKYILFATLLVLPLAACDDGTSPAEDEAGRGGVGKADQLEGSCAPVEDDAPACGGPAAVGECWCDSECADYGDCCVDAYSACGVGPMPAVADCDDGSAVHPLCDTPPACEDGTTLAVQGGCFSCVDPETCEAPEEPEPMDDCGDGSSLHPLCDVPPPCGDTQTLAVQNGCFACVDPQTCEPPPPVDDFPCDDGTAVHPLCDTPPACADTEVLAVQNGCFACVDPSTCEPPPPVDDFPCDDDTAIHPLCDTPPACAGDQILAVQNGCFACVDPVTCE